MFINNESKNAPYYERSKLWLSSLETRACIQWTYCDSLTMTGQHLKTIPPSLDWRDCGSHGRDLEVQVHSVRQKAIIESGQFFLKPPHDISRTPPSL